jgi:hypothetical protein
MYRNVVKYLNIVKPTTMCLALAGCALMSHAQKFPTQAAGADSDSSCTYNFSSGSGNTFLQYCVADTGNIVTINTPQEHTLLQPGGGTDGYGICNQDFGAASYFDWGIRGGDSGNWNSPVLLSQTPKSVKIARTTSDGNWTLTQTITQVPSTPGIQIVMALKNNTALPRAAYLVRFADVNVDSNLLNDFSSTHNGAAGWTPTIPFAGNFGTGLQLQNAGNSQFGSVSGYARTSFDGPNPCNFAADSSGTPIVNSDGSIALAYVDTIGANKTKTTTMIYRGF